MRPKFAIALLALTGCVFDPNVQAPASDADPNAPDADPFAADADPSAPDASPNGPDATPDAPDAAPPVPLINTDLVVRYFMDEAASGQLPTDLLDSAPSPMHVPISYGQATYVEVAGNRGLRWSTPESNGVVRRGLGSSKIFNQTNSSTTITFEVVTQISDAGEDSSSSQIVGMRGSNPDFMLVADGGEGLAFYWPYGNLGAKWDDVHSNERMVLHLVYNASDPTPANRIELYKNGVLVQKSQSSPPTLGRTVGLGTGDSFVIGNSPAQNSSLQGTIFYAAVYNQAMSPTDIGSNAARLELSDDE